MVKLILHSVRRILDAAKLSTRERQVLDDFLHLADAMSEAESQFHGLGERTRGGLVVCDTKWRILYANASAPVMFSTTPWGLLGSALEEWIDPTAFSQLEASASASRSPTIRSPPRFAIEALFLRNAQPNAPAAVVNLWHDLDAGVDMRPVPQASLLPPSLAERLSPRERAVIELVVRSGDLVHAAEQLAISRHTVRNHLKNSYSKLGVHSESDLLRLVLREASERR